MYISKLATLAVSVGLAGSATAANFICADGTKARCCAQILLPLGGKSIIGKDCITAKPNFDAGVPGVYSCDSFTTANPVQFCFIYQMYSDALNLVPASQFGYTPCAQNITQSRFSSCPLGALSVVLT
ncbi:hypothetical protein BP6252_13549 [Coleophoma cylindrospora]|uniref:Hydrophobin n=1 Tax=Coleophoma cylindrospora TaxID=1849047 RepID=A0A3D8Q933_9HELO|nr:hypothetical protein BP6252_13549 [Coleophoma cylindrospora]